jgi:hypothetical protein
MLQLNSRQAIQLAADFALTANYMKTAGDCDFQARVSLCEKASRIAFLKAHILAESEEERALSGESFNSVFAVA